MGPVRLIFDDLRPLLVSEVIEVGERGIDLL